MLESIFDLCCRLIKLLILHRNFCDAEAEMLGALPFNWNEWTFHIHRVRDVSCSPLYITVSRTLYTTL